MNINLKPKDYWATPEILVSNIAAITGLRRFDLDACAAQHNAKCADYISEQQNTLITEWGKNRNVWMNPPYSKPLPFVEKAAKECYLNQNNVVVLLNADTSTRWFSVCKQYASEIYFITGGRVGFLNYDTGAKTSGNNRPQMFACFYNSDNPRYSPAPKTHYIDLMELMQC